MKITHRNQFPELLKSMGLTGDAVEVGVAEGWNSFNLLDNWPGHLYMVDAWRILDEPGYGCHGEENDAKQEERYQRVLRAIQKYGNRATVVRSTSEEAARRIPNSSLDFAYLDGNHSLDAIRKDLSLWYPKLKSGAVFAGHDFLDGMHGGSEYGVKQAVTEFAAAKQVGVNVTSENDWPSFWMQV